MGRLKILKAYYDQLYRYKATITDVRNVHTIVCDVDLGFEEVLKNQTFVLRCNKEPKDNVAKIVSRDALREKILGKEVLIVTTKDENSSFIATIFLSYTIITEHSGESGLININEWLIDNNYAEYEEY